jgi:branched-subunit amino acid ABC-type transport system permease component
MTFGPAELLCQLLVGLSRAMILFIVSAGLSFVLGVLRVPNIAHGSLYMIGAFATFTITKMFAGSSGFWIALIVAPLLVAVVSLVAERVLFCHLYQREHLMLLLFTFAISLILGDLVKIVWGCRIQVRFSARLTQGFRLHTGCIFPAL